MILLYILKNFWALKYYYEVLLSHTYILGYIGSRTLLKYIKMKHGIHRVKTTVYGKITLKMCFGTLIHEI